VAAAVAAGTPNHAHNYSPLLPLLLPPTRQTSIKINKQQDKQAIHIARRLTCSAAAFPAKKQADPDSLKTVLEPMDVAEAGPPQHITTIHNLTTLPLTILLSLLLPFSLPFKHAHNFPLQADSDSLKTVLEPMEVAEAVSRSLPSAAAVVTTPNQRSTEILTLSSAAATAACLVYATG
jgi:hypothetical protein